MTVKEMIKELKRMNPEQKVVVAIDEIYNEEGFGSKSTEYVDVDCIAQTTKFVVLEITR